MQIKAYGSLCVHLSISMLAAMCLVYKLRMGHCSNFVSFAICSFAKNAFVQEFCCYTM